MKYIPLRVKTSYSILTSLIDIKKMILFCKEKGINTVGICDDNLFGVMEFYTECIKNNIKPLIGLSLNYDNDLLLLYAKNYSGYQNLTRLIYNKENNNLNINTLKEYSSDLICITSNIKKYECIYNDIYYGFDVYNKDEKGLYIPIINCLTKEDTKYLKYLKMIKENKKEVDSVDTCSYFTFDETYYDISKEISDKCNISFSFDKTLMPIYSTDSKERLLSLCKKGINKRLDSKVTKVYYDRLMYELSVIDKMGFNDYFLIVLDFIRYAKKNNIFVGLGRGSAASSLVAYSLGITEIDPIKYDLLFERFLNIERSTMPDIDTDFDATRKDEVLDYVRNKYGSDKVAPIITFSTLTFKQAIRDLSRIFEVDSKKLDRLSKLIGNKKIEELKKDEDFNDYVKYNRLNEIVDIALKLDGLKRQISVNAAGVVISSKPLYSYIPLYKYNDNFISGISKDYLESLGLFKMDFLSIKHLTDIAVLTNKLNVSFDDMKLDLYTFDIFRKGLTTGIFQFESDGMKSFLKRLEPNNIEDIFSSIALYRPGPINNINTYINRKNGVEKINYFDASLKPVLESTYGIIIYQEQILKIANILCNYTYSEADILRRAISKKNKDIILKEKEKFIERGINNGYKKELLSKVYDYIIPFSEYGFNKSHAVAYSFIAIFEAYLKSHYKCDYLVNLLNDNMTNTSKTKEIINECKLLDVNILKPDINKSMDYFIIEDNSIRYSLTSVTNFIVAREIISKRDKPFTSFIDFTKRCLSKNVNKDIIIKMINASLFDSFGINHNTLINNLDNIINYVEVSKDIDSSLIDMPYIKEISEYSTEELLEKEKEIYGFYLTNHPTTKYKINNEVVNLNDINKYLGRTINVIGLVEKIKVITDKNGLDMAFITISDEYSSSSITIFSNVYKNIDEINKNEIYLFNVKVGKRKSDYTLELIKLRKLN